IKLEKVMRKRAQYSRAHVNSFSRFVFSHAYVVFQVDPKFLRNMRFAKKHNKKGRKTIARKEASK
uniref:60S ribosomal protein L29 n=1 Tax=Sinocyclocheilus rhinocerous TaxID=307959 RepID=A0A673JYW2_9TELE